MRGLAIFGLVLTAASFGLFAFAERETVSGRIYQPSPEVNRLNREIDRLQRTARRLKRAGAYALALAYCNKAVKLDERRVTLEGYA